VIAHIILFRPQAALDEGQRMAVVDAFRAAVAAAPTVRGCRIGRRLRHGLPGYEQAMREDYEFAAIVEFDDVAGLLAYLRNPAHAGIGAQFGASAAAALAYDYEMESLETVSPDVFK
jgi:hypothetical protein